MSGFRTRIPGYRISRAGKLVEDLRRFNAAARRKRASEPVRVGKRSKAAQARLDFGRPVAPR
jgi:hypothetical protein